MSLKEKNRGKLSDLTFETGPDKGDDLLIYKINDKPGIYFENAYYNSYKKNTQGKIYKIVSYIDKEGIKKCRNQKTSFNKPEFRLDLILENGDSIGVKFNIYDYNEDYDEKYNKVVKLLQENKVPISTNLNDCNNMQLLV